MQCNYLRFYLMTILLLGNALLSYCQYNNMWVFGISAGVDFNTSPPTPVKTNFISNEACATICDASGKLLFYTDGSTVWDASYNRMPNGENLPGLDYNVVPSTSQGALITPVPGHPSLYYIFSLSCWDHSSGRYRQFDYKCTKRIGPFFQKIR